jgi:lipopolysaccharide export system protein LptC
MALGSDILPTQAQRRVTRLSRVKLLRRALPAAAVGLLLVCAAQVALGDRPRQAAPTRDASEAKMLKPRFSGRTPDGRSFVITGKDGMRENATASDIRISEPVLTLRRENGRTQQMTAKSGLYDEDRHTLLLTGDVRMDNGAGSRFAAKEARIDTRSGAISGQSGLRAEGQSGQVQAQTYEADEKGDRVILKGGVRGRLTTQN